MRNLSIALLICSWVGVTANAATLSVIADKSTYSLGETITLSIVGDSGGASALSVGGFLGFDESRVSWIATDQQALTSLAGAVEWVLGGVAGSCFKGVSEPAGCWAIAQLNGSLTPLAVDGPLAVTMTLTAAAAGVVDFVWSNDPSVGDLDFFGLTSAPGTSVTIVPEPGSAGLLALGLVGLWLSRRTRGHPAS